MQRFLLCAAALVAGLAGAVLPAQAQENYPNRPIKIMVPIPPGGAPDVVARLVGQYLSQALGQPVVIENRTGANGNIAGEAVAKAAPDGYTLILAADSGIVINPHVYAKMAFDPMKDLVPVTAVATNQFVLAVNPKVPVKTLPEFVEYAKKANPQLTFASGGVGSQHFFAMEQLKQRAGFNLLNITYRGGTPAMRATINGETQVLFAGGESAGQFKAGTLRALAMSGKERSKAMPDVPTIGETYPGYSAISWTGMLAPKGTPQPIIDRISSEMIKATKDPKFVKVLQENGIDPIAEGPEKFAAMIAAELPVWAKAVEIAGVKIQQ